MSFHRDTHWIAAAAATAASYRRMIDAAVSQLSDTELITRPRPDMNSVAVILRHLGGNLLSRWSDFWTTDGEKPNRDRDREFDDWEGDRESLLAYFNSGWDMLTKAIEQINETNVDRPLFIRGERHTVADALMRSLTHLSYHVGQITLLARLIHDEEWRWLTIPPGSSAEYNKKTLEAAGRQRVDAGTTEQEGEN